MHVKEILGYILHIRPCITGTIIIYIIIIFFCYNLLYHLFKAFSVLLFSCIAVVVTYRFFIISVA